MWTRQQYMKNECSHDDYYRQFVTPTVVLIVERSIGVERIKRSTDEHMNDIQLALWDRLDSRIRACAETKVREAGDSWSLGNAVCIAKAAARIIKERQ